MLTTVFWKRSAELAVRAFAHAFLGAAMLGNHGASVVGLDWKGAAGVAGAAALASVLTSVASSGSGERDRPTLVS